MPGFAREGRCKPLCSLVSTFWALCPPVLSSFFLLPDPRVPLQAVSTKQLSHSSFPMRFRLSPSFQLLLLPGWPGLSRPGHSSSVSFSHRLCHPGILLYPFLLWDWFPLSLLKMSPLLFPPWGDPLSTFLKSTMWKDVPSKVIFLKTQIMRFSKTTLVFDCTFYIHCVIDLL